MEKCHLFQSMSILGKKWTLPLLEEIEGHQGEGFNFFLKKMKKISPKVLSQRLSFLEDCTLITKRVTGDAGAQRTEYRLTKNAAELLTIIKALKMWNGKFSPEKNQCGDTKCTQCDVYDANSKNNLA